jgi:hypothetical protein
VYDYADTLIMFYDAVYLSDARSNNLFLFIQYFAYADGGGPEPRGGGECDSQHAAGLPGPLRPA